MPAQRSVWFDDQKRLASTCSSHDRPENTEDRSVDVGEVRASDLALQDKELVVESEDFRVTGRRL